MSNIIGQCVKMKRLIYFLKEKEDDL